MTRAILFLTIALALATSAFGEVSHFVYPTNEDWMSTSLNFTTGDTLTIQAQGLMNPGLPNNPWNGPDGTAGPLSDARYTQWNKHCLIARFGNTGTPFVVGSYRYLIAAESGELQFTLNDNDMSDNVGSFVISVIARIPIRYFVYPTNEDWMSTSLNFTTGDTLTIQAQGLMNPGLPNNPWNGPDGTAGPLSDARYTQWNKHCLIARFGNTGTPFVVGSYRYLIAAESGELQFTLNDNDMSDNVGSFVISVIGHLTPFDYSRSPRDNTTSSFRLDQNYPNPFNPSTSIGFGLPQQSRVQVTIYDALGRQTRQLFTGSMSVGSHALTWNGADDAGVAAPSGVYFCQVTANNISQTKQITLLK